jgi:hypothetical protein
MITIESSWGTIETDEQGNVLNKYLCEVDGEHCYLADVVRFDIQEFYTWFEKKFKEPSPKQYDFDVLDLGFWREDGSYDTADMDWRDRMWDTKF